MSETEFKSISVADLKSRLASQRRDPWLVDGLVPRYGVSLVVGAARAGKTMLLCALSATVQAGGPFLGRAAKQTNVMWIAEDRGRLGFVENMERACTSAGVDAGDLQVLDPPGWTLDDPDAVERLAQELDRREVGLLVIDCLRRVTRADENNSAAMGEVVRQLNRLAGDKRAVLVVHHLGASGKTRGSTDLPAGAESEIRVQKSPQCGVRIKASHHMAQDVVVSAKMTVDDSQLQFQLSDDTTDTTVEAAIMKLIQASPSGVTKTQIRKGVKGASTAKDIALSSLVDRGIVVAERGGRSHKYSLASPITAPEGSSNHTAPPPPTPTVPGLPHKGGEPAGKVEQLAGCAGQDEAGRGTEAPGGGESVLDQHLEADDEFKELIAEYEISGELAREVLHMTEHGPALGSRHPALDPAVGWLRQAVAGHAAAGPLSMDDLWSATLKHLEAGNKEEASIRVVDALDVLETAFAELAERAVQSPTLSDSDRH